MNYVYLDNDNKLKTYLQSLCEHKISLLAIDLEAEYNLHCYGEHLCLIQIYDGLENVLIDPFKVNMELVKNLLEDQSILKIFYDCSGDRTLLYRKYKINPRGILDLRPAVELLELPKQNLNYVLHEILGLELKPKKKFQQYNWMTRPIDEDALLYAVEDVKYLFELKKKLIDMVIRKDLLDLYILKNLEVQTRTIADAGMPGVFKKARFRNMTAKSRSMFKDLFYLREDLAKTLNWSPSSVVSNESLFLLSQEQLTPGDLKFSSRLKAAHREELQRKFQGILDRKDP